jgi:hypothetical protein
MTNVYVLSRCERGEGGTIWSVNDSLDKAKRMVNTKDKGWTRVDNQTWEFWANLTDYWIIERHPVQ